MPCAQLLDESVSDSVLLFSGGIDSATALAIALGEGRDPYLLCVDYGQRCRAEIYAADRVAERHAMDVHVARIPRLGELVEESADREAQAPDPGLSIALLGLAILRARSLGVREIWIGTSSREADYLAAFQSMADLAVPGPSWKVRSPLVGMTKVDVVRRGTELKVAYSLTHSCRDPRPSNSAIGYGACGRCDACRLRRDAFGEAGIPDQTSYA